MHNVRHTKGWFTVCVKVTHCMYYTLKSTFKVSTFTKREETQMFEIGLKYHSKDSVNIYKKYSNVPNTIYFLS